jgi:alpha-beta hydrolase superfamily lysophospholipase
MRCGQRACFSPAILLALIAGALSTLGAQASSPDVQDMLRASWRDGVEAALAAAVVPERPPGLDSVLVDLAEELLWTGRTGDALRVMALADSLGTQRVDRHLLRIRGLLMRTDSAGAREALQRGIAEVGALARQDPSHGRLLSRLRNRLVLLNHTHEYLDGVDVYQFVDGSRFAFTFDPWLSVFPAWTDLRSGRQVVLVPDTNGTLTGTVEGDTAASRFTFAIRQGRRRVHLQGPATTREGRGIGIRQEPFHVASDSLSVSGTMFVPGEGAVGGIVLNPGAGATTRFNLAAEALAFAAQGIAAAAYDKPGLGSSHGANWLLLSIEEQATIALRVRERLSRVVGGVPIGYWGFSQGGWVAPLAASRDSLAAFVVTVSGAAVSPEEQDRQRALGMLPGVDTTVAAREAMTSYLDSLWSLVNDGAAVDQLSELVARANASSWGTIVQRPRLTFEPAWWRSNQVAPATILADVRAPYLAIFGADDVAVPHALNVPVLLEHLASHAGRSFQIVVLGSTGHSMTLDAGYHPGYLAPMIAWVWSVLQERPPEAIQ